MKLNSLMSKRNLAIGGTAVLGAGAIWGIASLFNGDEIPSITADPEDFSLHKDAEAGVDFYILDVRENPETNQREYIRAVFDHTIGAACIWTLKSDSPEQYDGLQAFVDDPSFSSTLICEKMEAVPSEWTVSITDVAARAQTLQDAFPASVSVVSDRQATITIQYDDETTFQTVYERRLVEDEWHVALSENTNVHQADANFQNIDGKLYLTEEGILTYARSEYEF